MAATSTRGERLRPRPGEGGARAIVLAVGFGVLSAWNLGFSGYAPFYAWAARSMAHSWHAFLYGALDAGSHITMDKLSGFLVPQAISVRLFGFHAWSLALPQVLEGMVTVLAVFVAGRRWRGHRVGLLAAAMTATTPLLGSMFGRTMEDGLLTMSLALALACWLGFLRTGRWASLAWTAVWVGIGFQAKMMQAWLILPALVIGTAILAGAGAGVRLRLARCATLVGVALAVSVSWMCVIQLTPAADRPYIDATTNNNVFSMVFGFNGINRMFPGAVAGVVPQVPAAGTGVEVTHRPAFALAAAHRALQHHLDRLPTKGWGKLLDPAYGTQVGWLFPLALAGLAFGLYDIARRGRRGPAAATTVVLGVWLALAVAVLSAVSVPHPAYLSAISVQVALLAAAGVASAVRMLRSHRPHAPLVVAGLVVAETAWSVRVAAASGVAPGYLVPVLIAVGVVALTAVSAGRRALRAVAVGLVAVALTGPLVWSGWLLSGNQDGTAGDSYAGPRPPAQALAYEGSTAAVSPSDQRPFTIPAPFSGSTGRTLSGAQNRLLAYLTRESDGHAPVLAVDEWVNGVPFVLADGLDVVPIGGFTGRVPAPAASYLRAGFADGTLRFVLLAARPLPDRAPQIEAVLRWIRSSCAEVPAHRYGGNRTMRHGSVLYDCRAS